ncbi:MAG: response regulator transcription factor [Clostridiales bacterium]|nr:response regulator transcription factor [Clostridiales bacterium]
MKLLLVEDEERIAQALKELLIHENYDVDLCPDGISGMEAVETGLYDIIILDVMLPGKSGFEITRQARRQGIKTPILILTARNDLEDKVEGLDCGADDYLTKPFMTKELLARLRALSRRITNSPDYFFSFGDLQLDTGTSTLKCTPTGQSVRLSEKEYRILEYLFSNQGKILGREQIALRVWGYESEAEYNNVEVYLSFTRKKLAFIGSSVKIKSIRNMGYELRYENV